MNRCMKVTAIALIAVAACALALMPGCGKPSITTMAENLVDSSAKGDFSAATEDFDGTMKNALPPEKLEATWKQIQAQVGAFKSRTGTRQADEQGYKMVYVTCEFERMSLNAKVVFDSSSKVSGLWFLPVQPAGGK